MYKQIIPKSYFDHAEELNIKPLVQAIYLANSYSSHEQRVLTELSLDKIFKKRHMSLYNRYRSNYNLFEDFTKAKQQVQQVIDTEQLTTEYWRKIPHPLNNSISHFDNIEEQAIH